MQDSFKYYKNRCQRRKVNFILNIRKENFSSNAILDRRRLNFDNPKKTCDQIEKEFTDLKNKFEKKKDKKMYMKRGATAIVLNHDNNIVDKDLEIFKNQKKLLEYIIVYLINF